MIPWEDRPAGSSDVLWRSSRNPIVTRERVPGANSIFNSAVVRFGDGFAGVFRVDDTTRVMNVHAGRSDDGIEWDLDPEPISFVPTDARVSEIQEEFLYAYDPRVTWLEDRFYVTWCAGYHGPTIGVAYTHDFETFHRLDNAFLPFNRNGVLFPRKIGGSYAMLSRPSDDGHTPFGDIYYSESPDLVHWGRHRHVLGTRPWTWESTKVGAGPTPIETAAGWLVVYHGVLTSCNGFVYSMGAALLDLDEPWKIVARSSRYLLAPHEPYERVGDVPNVVFPCAALVDAEARPAVDLLRRRGHGRLPRPRAPLRGARVRPRVGERLRQRSQEVVDRDERKRLELRAAARAQRDRDLRDRHVVWRLDDVHEVVLAERGPLVQHLRSHLLDVAVDLTKTCGVRVERLDPLLGEAGQHQVRRHLAPLVALRASVTEPPGRRTGGMRRGRAAARARCRR